MWHMQLTEGITLFLRVKWSYCMDTPVRTHVREFGGVVFSLTNLNIVELVIFSIAD